MICIKSSIFKKLFLFLTGGFPANLVLSVIKNFLDRRNNTTTVPDEANEHIKYISLPYFGPQSEKLKNETLSRTL